MPSSPEELLRSIERTREELALTVDTIAGRLDPRVAAKRGVGRVRASVTGVFDGARGRTARPSGLPERGEVSFDGSATSARGAYRGGEQPDRPSASSAAEAAHGAARDAVTLVSSAARQIPPPAIVAALAALVAFAAIIATRRRRPTDTSHR